MEFSQEQHDVWRTLNASQTANLAGAVCSFYERGTEILELPADHIPSLAHLNRRIQPRTGWRVIRTAVRYSDAVPWYTQFSRKCFMVTDYMRTMRELDFTPEPDMFHDIFGHLPYMALPEYTELQEMFAPAFFRASEKGREVIKRLAWYSTEFGLIREGGELKVFGAGLVSSAGELANVVERTVDIQPFTVENVIGHEKAVWSFNDVLFYFDSLDDLVRELQRGFDYATQEDALVAHISQ
ncbi:MAG: hypothetical protein WBR18_10395 [Anaerolineales bacterium]